MGNAFEQMAVQENNPQSKPVTQSPSVDIPQPVIPVATDQRGVDAQDSTVNIGGQSFPAHGVSQAQTDAAVTPPTNGNAFEAMSQQDEQQETEAGKERQKQAEAKAAEKPTRVGQLPRAGEVWEGVSEPLIPRGHLSKALGEYATSAPTNSSAKKHYELFGNAVPNLKDLSKAAAGTVADTMEFARSMTSPLMIGTLEAGEIAKAGGVLGKLAKAGGLLTGFGFGAQGAVNAYEGVHKMGTEGVTPENVSQTLTGAAQVPMGLAGGLHETKVGKTNLTPGINRPSVENVSGKVSGVDIPRAKVVEPDQNLPTKIASHLTSVGKTEANLKELEEEAAKVNEGTYSAAQRAAVSTLSQVATDKIAAHEALAEGKPAPEEITGTDTPGQHLTPDEIWPDMQDSANKTWDKARDASARELDAWKQQRAMAEASHQAGIDHYNSLAEAHNADPANADNLIEPLVFNPEEVDAPEKPKGYDDLKAELDAAKDRTGRLNPTDVRQKAKTIEVPKAEKALDQWFKEHEDTVSPAEYQSAKQLWADSERFKEIATSLRGKIAKGTLNGNDIRGLEAVVDGKAVRRRGAAGIGEFNRLLGPEAVDNLKNVAQYFDPLDKNDPRSTMIPSWGGWIARHALSTVLAPALGGLGYLGVEGANILLETFMNHVMFDPEFGSTFSKIAEATKNAMETGTQVPVTLAGKFRDMLLGIAAKYKASRLGGEEGAVGAGVKRKNVGPNAGARPLSPTGTPLPKSWPSDDKLVEKYGEASDPAQTAFLLTDGRKVKMPLGSEHDRMLGGKPTDDFRTPYINDTGNIRMRAYGVYGDRQFGLSLPKDGITEAQLKEILKWGPQLRTGRVFLEQADANGKNVVLHNATNEQLEQGIRSIVPVKGAPEGVKNPVAALADEYNQAQGRRALDQTKKEPDARRAQIADAFDAMKHDPTDPKVKAAYEALINETKAQKKFLESKGYKFDQSENDPYTGFEQMRDDVRNNKHISVWTGGNPLPEDHPLGKIDKETGWRNNDLMRGVHDVMGHVAGDNDFSEKGEENAYNLHRQAFSEAALPALATETKGQTSWFWNNKDIRSGKTVPGEFPEQKAGILPEHTYSDNPVKNIVSLTNTNGGATYNPTKGDLSGTDAYAVPMRPDLSRTIEGTAVTPQRVQSYLDIPGVKDALANDSELSIGTWVNNGKVYFDLSKAIPDRAEAIRIGNENGQKAITYLKNFEEIPLDNRTGTGMALTEPKTFAGHDFSADRAATDQALQELKDGKITRGQLLSRAQELKENAIPADASASEITTRRPTSVKGDLNNNPAQHANWDAIEQAGRNNPGGATALGKTKLGYKEKLARTVADYTGIEYTPEELKNPDKVLSKFVSRVSENLESLYNQVPPEIRDQTRKWYDAAHDVVSAKAREYGFTPEQGAGVTAALSPQNPWDNNLGLANRMMDIYKNRQNFPYSPEMESMAAELKKVPTQTKAFKGLLKDIAGKTLSEVKNADPDVQAVQRALWIRLYDEAHGSPINDQYAPTGEVVGHSPDTKSWIGLDHASKAVKIMEDGSVDNINNVMGQGHKIRNFYNNIINPNSKAGHVTIDTHATAAAHLQPFGAKDTETAHTFGNTPKGVPGAPKDASTGLQGTYPLYAEAYQRTARKLGILPRELQSVTWEAIKSLMGDEKKTPELKAQAKEIWQDVQDGKLTPTEARDRIKTISGGFAKPAWMSDEEWEKTGPEGEDTSFTGDE